MSASRPAPVDSLVLAAVSGLFAACGDPAGDRPRDPDGTCETAPDTDTEDTDLPTIEPLPEVISIEVNTTILFDEFKARCDARAGLLQTTAACAGTNSCRGFSFNVNSKELMEHTCRGANSCHGISCVELPADRGFDGETVYLSTCAYVCHGPPAEATKILVPAGKDHEEAIAEFETTPRDHYVSMVAFGMHGMNPNGTASAMAPPRHEDWSVAELGRAIDHMRSLPYVVEEFGTVGVDMDLN